MRAFHVASMAHSDIILPSISIYNKGEIYESKYCIKFRPPVSGIFGGVG
jgi:hypothetical protein